MPLRAQTIIVALAACPAAAQTTVGDLQGTWATPLVEMPAPGGGASAHVRQTGVFEPGCEVLRVEAFAGEGAARPLFTYESFGPYTDRGPWDAGDGARALDLVNESSTVAIFVDALEPWRGIGLAECDLVVGEAVEIADCMSGPPFQVADCTDLNVVIVDQGGERLRFGSGEMDRCTTRPTEPSDTAFFKVP